jgi:predicted membrane protein
VESGLPGAVFWIWCFLLALRALLRLFAENDRLSPLIVFIAVSFMWDILFSPYGGLARLSAMFYVVTLMSFLACSEVRARYRDYLIRPVRLARMGLRGEP